MLKAHFTKQFQRDTKRLERRHINLDELENVIDLILEDTAESRETLRRRHRAHRLKGDWHGTIECHVGNTGDWLTVWIRDDGTATFMRTGSHKELFGKD
ncbi:type II toxin-antitoxin system YafQ family toxin [Bifidobacterium panos]|uniref:type II toxin-antitoxin system RelE/ParE family toxin n=1 Tax=Bifidobacterium panos TaxID=2675321 RepID=UPI001556ECC7